VILQLNQSWASSDTEITTRHWKHAEMIVIDPKLRTLAWVIDLLEICLKIRSDEWMQHFPLPEGALPWRSEEATTILLSQTYQFEQRLNYWYSSQRQHATPLEEQ
jgi:hypothetical protein